MNNVVINKTVNSSSHVSPFAAGKAVDGTLTPLSRWLCDAMPCWLQVDLGKNYYIQRWVVKHMGAVGWQSPSYNMIDYSLQGSLDNANFSSLDSVTSNSLSSTDRVFPFAQARYVRVNVTKGLNINKGVASVVGLEVYGTCAVLSALVIKVGKTTIYPNPQFSPTIFSYTASVANSVTAVTVIPTALDGGAAITVNGQPVISGQAQSVNLNVGQNTITMVVTTDGNDQNTYTITVTRASS
ncbi:hypothetical protein DCCM_0274 [Desulfocucumis palustris]|uniref:F5/8 type C domain-containing protein n=1 Tax=Desulfocucumis palustris TaxID=1898651 RepID=A0A2L2X919_9FIRM|nr:cadherin-like beta sandwich domain-containing protein [Desulfocucumis palustris]GBF32083.1 hypothetical protein DCCM_0274 [Desulfocucumis palustris]